MLLLADGSLTPFKEATLDAALDRYSRLSRGWNESDRTQGQMLIAMLLAATAYRQNKNANGKYLYGCFVKEQNRSGRPLAFYDFE